MVRKYPPHQSDLTFTDEDADLFHGDMRLNCSTAANFDQSSPKSPNSDKGASGMLASMHVHDTINENDDFIFKEDACNSRAPGVEEMGKLLVSMEASDGDSSSAGLPTGPTVYDLDMTRDFQPPTTAKPFRRPAESSAAFVGSLRPSSSGDCGDEVHVPPAARSARAPHAASTCRQQHALLALLAAFAHLHSVPCRP